MRTAALLSTLGLATGGLLALGAVAPASAAPKCADPVAQAIHKAEDLAGPAGGPIHVVEGVYCSVKPR